MDVPVTISKSFIKQDAWRPLKKFTNARIAIGRTGNAIPLSENLSFRADHALARDAVYTALNANKLAEEFAALGMPILLLQSCANNRGEYLQRPDWGRQLNEASKNMLLQLGDKMIYDVAVIIADGLSAHAVHQHSRPVLKELLDLCNNDNYSIAPLCIVQQGRVAISDEIGFLLKAKISIILIGERPGLSSPHSMGVYLTYQPAIGNTDERRNCISNIHPQGLNYLNAAKQAFALMQKAMALKVSGVGLRGGDDWVIGGRAVDW